MRQFTITVFDRDTGQPTRVGVQRFTLAEAEALIDLTADTLTQRNEIAFITEGDLA